MAVRFMGYEVLQIPLFRNPKWRRLLRVPQFGPQNPAYGGDKISVDNVHSVCSQGVLEVPLLVSILLRAFSGVDTGAPGIKSDWHSCHLQLLSHLRATPVVVGLLATVPPGTISSARPQQMRKLRARLKKYARLSAGTFSRLTVLSIWVPGVSQIMSLCFLPQWWYVTLGFI